MPGPLDPPSFDALITHCGLPRLEARLLLTQASGLRREALIANGERPCPSAARERFDDLVERRLRGEPIAYLLGTREFYGRTLHVDRRVLIPRPDTETLVEQALTLLAPLEVPRVLDLGTGSGAIAITLALERMDAVVVATDRSRAALEVAASTAAMLGARVTFSLGDWWTALDERAEFDLIASNPPYIAETDPHLGVGDLRHEPREALTPGGDGTGALAVIIAGARSRLRDRGWLLVEHGFDQGSAARAAFRAAGFEAVETRTDPGGNERTTCGLSPARCKTGKA